jgi:hypothetical protein
MPVEEPSTTSDPDVAEVANQELIGNKERRLRWVNDDQSGKSVV